MSQTSNTSATGPAPGSALSAFLRGIERRAYVLALAQCGRSALAQAALSQTLRAFQSVAGSTPLSAWPATFWSLLLAQPELSQGEAGEAELRPLSSGPRAALLLRLVAGLDFAHASQVLGVAEPAFRYASQRALQQLGEAGVSYAALAALRERLHRQIKALPEADLQALASTRDQALQAPAPAVPVAVAPAPRRQRLLWLALAGLGLAFAATWWPATAPPLPPGGVQPLAEADPLPAATAPSEADRVIHPDYELLADPARAALAQQLALLSWWSAQRAPSAAEPEVATDALSAPPADALTGNQLPAEFARLLAPLQPSWSRLDAETRRRVLANARHWQALAPAAQRALVARMMAWDARPGAERALERAAFAAWQRLSAAEQAGLTALAADWAVLPADERARLQVAFAALPPDQHQDWWLGPRAGAGFAALRPLFAFVPEAERAALIELLRELPDSARSDLAQLAARLPAEAREQLRRELLAQQPAARADWIRARLAAP